MSWTTIYSKTAKGLLAVSGKGRRVTREQMALLKLVDGTSSEAQLLANSSGFTEDEMHQGLESLASDGYLKAVGGVRQAIAEPEDLSVFATIQVEVENTQAFFDAQAEMALFKEPSNVPKAEPQPAVKKRETSAAPVSKEEAERARVEAAKQARAALEQMAREETRLEEERRAKVKTDELARQMAEHDAGVQRALELFAQEEAEARAKAEEAEAKARARAVALELARKQKEEEARAIAERKARAEADARAAAEEQRRREAELQARILEEERRRAEAEELARTLEEQRGREESARREREAAEARARAEAEEQVRREAEQQARLLEEEQVRAEAEESARRQQEQIAREEAERETAAALAKAEAEERSRGETERKARLVAEQQAMAEARSKVDAEELARKKKADAARAEATWLAHAKPKVFDPDEVERVRREARQQAKAAALAQLKAESEAISRRLQEQAARVEARRLAREEAEARERSEEQARIEAQEKVRMQQADAERAKAELLAREAAEALARAEAEQQARRDAELQAIAEAEARARAEAEEQARIEAERLARVQQEEAARLDAEARAKADKEAEEAAKKLQQEQARDEEERLALQAWLAAERLAAAEAEERAKAEAEEAARKQQEEAARVKAERLAREEAAARAIADAEMQARREAEQQALAAAEAERLARKQREDESRAEAERRVREEMDTRARAGFEQKIRREAENFTIEDSSALARPTLEFNAIAAAAAQAEAEARARIEALQRERDEAMVVAIADVAARDRRLAQERSGAETAEPPQLPVSGKVAAPERAKADDQESEEPARDEAEELAHEHAPQQSGQGALARGKEKAAGLFSLFEPYWTVFGRAVRWGRIAALVLLVVLGLPLMLFEFASLDGIIPRIETIASERLGEPVSIGRLQGSLWPSPHLEMADLRVGRNKDVRIGVVRATPALDSMFDETTVLRKLEVEGLAVEQGALPRMLDWLGDDQRQKRLQLTSLTLKNTALAARNIPLPSFDATVQLSHAGRFESASLSSADGKMKAELAMNGNRVEIDFNAQQWLPPLGPPRTYDSFRAKAVADAGGMRINEIVANVSGGTARARASVSWARTWRVDGEFTLAGVDPQKAVPQFAGAMPVSGALQAKGGFSMAANSLDRLFDNLRLQAAFDIKPGILEGIDLARMIRGGDGNASISGQTRFAEMTGQMTFAGNAYQYRQLKLVAGLLVANGSIDVSSSGELSGNIIAELGLPTSAARSVLVLSGRAKNPQLGRSRPARDDSPAKPADEPS
jgi:hypothetical protein